MSRSKLTREWDEVGGFGVLPVDRRRARKAHEQAVVKGEPEPEREVAAVKEVGNAD